MGIQCTEVDRALLVWPVTGWTLDLSSGLKAADVFKDEDTGFIHPLVNNIFYKSMKCSAENYILNYSESLPEQESKP